MNKKPLKQINIRVEEETYKEFQELLKYTINKEKNRPYTASEILRKYIFEFVDERKRPKLPLFEMETKI
jgi:hypothetical protein